jgi:nucleotide-binding universal stress UspA family protein
VIERILIPIDFSEESRRAVTFALQLAQQLGAAVRVVNVLDAGDLRAAVKAGLSGFTDDADLHRRLDEWNEEEYRKLSLPEHVSRMTLRGDVIGSILAAVASFDAQLVVMGSAGLGRRLPIGSKTEELIRRAKVPVVVVR